MEVTWMHWKNMMQVNMLIGWQQEFLLTIRKPMLRTVYSYSVKRIRPQQKEAKKKNAMLSELAVGDTVLTTSGFYGTVIDIADDTVIVEFGNNKNCRIPMQKAAISAVEKPEEAMEK